MKCQEHKRERGYKGFRPEEEVKILEISAKWTVDEKFGEKRENE